MFHLRPAITKDDRRAIIVNAGLGNDMRVETQLPVQPAMADIQGGGGVHNKELLEQVELGRVRREVRGQPEDHPVPLDGRHESVVDVGKDGEECRWVPDLLFCGAGVGVGTQWQKADAVQGEEVCVEDLRLRSGVI